MRRKPNMTTDEMIAWLETQYDLNENGCWIWRRNKIKGYGQVRWKGLYCSVHRLYWLLSGRTIPEGLDMCHGHGCSRACYNPAHLSTGTRAENMADKIRDGTDARGAKSANAKLTAEQVLAIRASEKSGKELSEEYGVSRTLISRIILRKCWTYI